MNVPSWPVHEAIRSEYNGRESLFECLMPGCRFRAVLDHVDGGYTLLDRGDPAFRHHGSTGPIVMTVDDTPTEPPQAA
jgi:hypothetical protein